MRTTRKKRWLRLLSGLAAVTWFLTAFPVAVLAAGRVGTLGGLGEPRNRLYNNRVAGRVIGLQAALAGELETRGVPTFLVSLLGLTPEKAADFMPEYPGAARILRSLGDSWEKYDPEALEFNIAAGDKEAFLRACAAGLRPVTSLLALTGDLYDTKVPGQYETAVLPLLEALDCPDILSAAMLTEQYHRVQASREKRHDYLADALLRPLFGLAEEVMSAPLRRLPEILPNLAWQMERGLLEPLFGFKLRLLAWELEVSPVKSVEELLGLLESLPGAGLPPIDLHRLAQAGTPARRATLRAGMDDAPCLRADRVKASALLAGWAIRLFRHLYFG